MTTQTRLPGLALEPELELELEPEPEPALVWALETTQVRFAVQLPAGITMGIEGTNWQSCLDPWHGM